MLLLELLAAVAAAAAAEEEEGEMMVVAVVAVAAVAVVCGFVGDYGGGMVEVMVAVAEAVSFFLVRSTNLSLGDLSVHRHVL